MSQYIITLFFFIIIIIWIIHVTPRTLIFPEIVVGSQVLPAAVALPRWRSILDIAANWCAHVHNLTT